MTLPPPQSDLAQQTIKDPYVFDFLTISEEAHERELESGLVDHVQKFLLQLGAGFAFVGRQVPIAVGDDDFFLDLLFYHLKLRCFVVIDMKMKKFTRLVWVGDRGMITTKRIDEDLRDVEGLDWITALRNESIRKLVDQKTIQLSLFDERDLAVLTSDDYPDERLIVCRNPLLADERARKRNELLAAAETKLDAVVKSVSREKQPP